MFYLISMQCFPFKRMLVFFEIGRRTKKGSRSSDQNVAHYLRILSDTRLKMLLSATSSPLTIFNVSLLRYNKISKTNFVGVSTAAVVKVLFPCMLLLWLMLLPVLLLTSSFATRLFNSVAVDVAPEDDAWVWRCFRWCRCGWCCNRNYCL